MNQFKLFLAIFVLSVMHLNGQEALIVETDSIKLHDTPVSKILKDNLFPVPYKGNLAFVNGSISDYYMPYVITKDSTVTRLRVPLKFRLGGMSFKDDEAYFTGISRTSNNKGKYNLTIFRGIIDGNRITKSQPLPLCNPNYLYAHPSISPSGDRMVVVTNERGLPHIRELVRNDSDEWEHAEPVFITHKNFDILNPTYLDENTIYFSSNIKKGKVSNVEFTMDETGDVSVKDVSYETDSYNIYVTRRENESWTLPRKVGYLSSDFDDFGVRFISEKTGYITSFRFDNTDNIYYFELKF